MSFGDGASITREEVKFGKFIYRLRNRFTQLFDVLLSTQLRLKGIIAQEDWLAIRQKIYYDFLKDTYYSEMKNQEILRNRAGIVDAYLQYAGKLVSWEWIRRVCLQQNDDQIKELDSQMNKEKNDPRYQALEALTGGMMPGMGGPGGDMGMGGMPGQDGMPPGMEGGMGGDPNAAAMSDGQPGQEPEDEEDGPPPENLSKNVQNLWNQ
jgi:hypothetical protein